MPSPRSKPASRTSFRRKMHTISIRGLRSQPMRFVCRPGRLTLIPSPGESVAVSPSHDCYCQNPICCCLMSPPTILMRNPWHGSSTSSRIFRERWSQLLTIAIFWTTRRAGFLSWIAGVASPMRGITPRGWKQKRNGSSKSSAKRPHIRRPSRQSWSGCGRIQKVAKQRIKRACNALMSSTPKNFRAATRPMKSTYRPGRALAIRSLR